MGGRFRHRHASPGDALTMLERSHARIAEELDKLRSAATRWSRHRAPDALESARAVARFLDRAARRHEADEEDSIFPRLPASAAPLVAALRSEHAVHSNLIDKLTADVESTSPDPDALDDLATEIQAAYRAHIAREDSDLLPLIRALTPASLTAAFVEMQLRRGR